MKGGAVPEAQKPRGLRTSCAAQSVEKKGNPRSLQLKYVGGVDKPTSRGNLHYTELLCGRVELEQRNIVDPCCPMVLVIRS
jgi:hypothetical protein